MRSRERLSLVAIALLLSLFAVALGWSVLRRTRSTFGYPDYSSLSAGDKGLKAFHDSLERVGYGVARNFKPLQKLTGKNEAVVYAGSTLESFRHVEEDTLELFETLARSGCGVVILLSSEGPMAGYAPTTLETRWGIRVESDRERHKQALVTYRITKWPAKWQASHVSEGVPLFFKRRWGKGSVLLITDAEAFTNQRLLTKPNGQKLLDALGGYQQVDFDESHLGVADAGTVAGLATAHHLQWLLAGFLLLATLYVWRSATPFITGTEVAKGSQIAGIDAYRALSNLLKQSVPLKQILQAVALEWNRSRAFRGRWTRDIGEDELSRLSKVSTHAAAREYNALRGWTRPEARLDMTAGAKRDA